MVGRLVFGAISEIIRIIGADAHQTTNLRKYAKMKIPLLIFVKKKCSNIKCKTAAI